MKRQQQQQQQQEPAISSVPSTAKPDPGALIPIPQSSLDKPKQPRACSRQPVLLTSSGFGAPPEVS